MTSPGGLQTESERAGHPLDDAVWASLRGAHATLAAATGSVDALGYRPEVSALAALVSSSIDGVDGEGWARLRALAGPDRLVAMFAPLSSLASLPVQEGWQNVVHGMCLQMVATEAVISRPDPEAVVLGADDVGQILELVALAQPGPFEAQTYRMGTYLGIRRGGRLVAMAGQRLHPPGWCEVSAVCTDPQMRGQGLASRLILAGVEEIRVRGETPFLHTWVSNVSAIRLYRTLGFIPRREVGFFAVRTPPAG